MIKSLLKVLPKITEIKYIVNNKLTEIRNTGIQEIKTKNLEIYLDEKHYSVYIKIEDNFYKIIETDTTLYLNSFSKLRMSVVCKTIDEEIISLNDAINAEIIKNKEKINKLLPNIKKSIAIINEFADKLKANNTEIIIDIDGRQLIIKKDDIIVRTIYKNVIASLYEDISLNNLVQNIHKYLHLNVDNILNNIVVELDEEFI